MLDPRTIRALAARPGDNGRELNVAIAEEGDAHALVSLLRHPHLEGEAVATIAARVLASAGIEVGPEEEPPRIEIPWEPTDEPRPTRPWTLDRGLLALVVAHPNAPAGTLVSIAERHAGEPGFVLGAAIAAHAPIALAERLATWPSRSALHDRMWIDLLAARPDMRELVEMWSTSESELLREAAARLSHDAAVLERLAHDSKRRVRRSVALNPSATSIRARMIEHDDAVEVRACAESPPQPHGSTQASRALARAARALERGGDRCEAAAEAIVANAHAIDPELAWLAGLVLDPEVVAQVAQSLVEHDAQNPSVRALIGAAMVRPGDDRASRVELAGVLARAIVGSYVPASTEARGLTGQARLVTFLAELLSDTTLVDEPSLVSGIAHGALVSDPALMVRWVRSRSAKVPGLMGRILSGLVRVAATEGVRPPASVLEAAWSDASIAVADVAKLARIVRARRDAESHLRGRADGTRVQPIDFDPDPSMRPGAEMTRVIEAIDPWVRVSPRAALVFLAATPKALAIGGSELRQWGDGVVASQLQRILRATRGSTAGDPRVARLDLHADAAGIAAALLAKTANGTEVASLLQRGLRLADGMLFAARIGALRALDRRDDVRVLVDVISARRRDDAASLCAWLVVGEIDRPRTVSVLAGALDAPCACTSTGPLPAVCEALTVLERRSPGTLERLRASSRDGRTAVVNALARAYPGLVGQ